VKRPIAFVASAVMLGAVLAACEAGEGGSGWCTDDALIVPAKTSPKPTTRRTSWKPSSPKTSQPSYRKTSKPHGSHGWALGFG
jgi:hypothetical protein